ncbi:hypothetical protein PUR49_08115 [Streptomyces sp. BE147]|uniref:hypothetical protein n=1 Tax=Streptomyces sp. BE147 TaxID=3002524 RepID=UPI002E75ADE3|nr:hypothetical protein [Streptomyces sp. BE147]MEE1736463.1 hypothetical protein [Streptomyces sp. BE147]
MSTVMPSPALTSPVFTGRRTFRFALSDYAHAAAESLGTGWNADDLFLGASGLVFTTDGTWSFRLYVDHDNDLTVTDRYDGSEAIVPTFELGTAPMDFIELAEWGKAIADVIRHHVVANLHRRG